MADSAYFQRSGPFTTGELARLASCELAGRADISISDVADLSSADANTITFLDNPKYTHQASGTKAAACIMRPSQRDIAPQGCVLLLTEQPYVAYALIAQAFYPSRTADMGIHPTAIVHPTAVVPESCAIGPGVVLEEGVVLGKHVSIGAHTIICRGVQIGEQSLIAPHVTISHAHIGSHTIIHPGVRIGQDGFGFAFAGNRMEKVPQLGRVIIGNYVEIGANSCVDRGAGPDTVIGDYTKIDNMVQIGHNVHIGRACVIVSQVGISGSTQLGDGVVIAGQTGVAGHLKIGSGAKVAAKAGVTKDLAGGQDYGGFPAIPVREWRKQAAMLARMTKNYKSE